MPESNPASGRAEAATAHDPTAEQHVIGSALLDRKWANALAPAITPDAFYQPIHTVIWEAIRHILRTETVYDSTIVAQRLADIGELKKLPNGAAYLHTCMTTAVIPENSQHQARRIMGLANKRQAATRLLRLQQQLTEADPDTVGELMQAASAELSTLSAASPGVKTRFVKGGSFLLDTPDTPPALWGRDREILWARGEALVLAGPQGVGKTTLAAQLLRASLGLQKEVLGYPVQPCTSRVLYLAMDRPQQAARCLGRIFTEEERRFLDECLVFLPGPPPEDVAANPETLLAMAREAEADVVFVDSLKDAAIGLSKDEVGAGYNRARQKVIADGRQIIELHHTVKGSSESPPNHLSGVYGSTWITSGAGSVVMLWGNAGDPIVDLLHLKPPMEDVGPLKVKHDHARGVSSVWYDEDADVIALARRCKTTGITAVEAAECLYQGEIRGGKPTPAQKQKARRVLEKHVASGLLVERKDDSGRETLRWFAAAPSGWEEGS